jgi:hypothetical protein
MLNTSFTLRSSTTVKIALCILLAVFFLSANSVFAEEGEQLSSETSMEEEKNKRLLLIPFPFFNDSIGTGVGVAAIAEGYIQPQLLTVGAGLYSLDGTYLLFLMARNYQVPFAKRVFLEPSTFYGKFTDIQSYTRNSPAFPNERAGSNDSSKENFIEADGNDNMFKFRVKYLLPIGHGKDNILPKIKLDDGIPVSGQQGGESWNPLASGRTYIELEPHIRKQTLDDANNTVQETLSLKVALTHDNTDFKLNPSKGSFLSIFYDRDWGTLNDANPWTVWGGEFAKYFSLGPSRSARQRVVAFNFWSVDSPTWNDFDIESGQQVFHRPPTYKGANLGGLWRMRGYPATRFNDRAAVYYALEYRHTLSWNPLKNFTMKGKLDLDWFQLVGFGELGRVAPSWKIDTLHSDMKWSVGGGIRSMLNHIVIRVDFALSEEEGIAQLFIGHPWPSG